VNISSFVKTIDKQKLNCEGVVVLRHGEKVAEYRWVPEKPRNSFSVSKSFVAVAVGMAVDRQKLSLASRAVDFFPETRRPGKALSSLTLEHLLTMTRGHATFSRPATVAEALAQPLTYRPGERFVYDNGSTFLASAMFTRAMGINVRGFLLKELFGPLGIDAPEWEESPDGHTVGATGLMLTTGALARFGQFLLQKGEWHQEQLMSAAWIESASRPHVGTGMRGSDRDLGYGYCFWPCRHGAYRADGKLGQFVVVMPLRDAVVAVNSDETKPYPILDAVWDEILPLL
jgi:CubicO group peptidase (beta-lactamase class C family)